VERSARELDGAGKKASARAQENRGEERDELQRGVAGEGRHGCGGARLLQRWNSPLQEGAEGRREASRGRELGDQREKLLDMGSLERRLPSLSRASAIGAAGNRSRWLLEVEDDGQNCSQGEAPAGKKWRLGRARLLLSHGREGALGKLQGAVGHGGGVARPDATVRKETGKKRRWRLGV
jgi:hypothetical protein